MLHVTRDVAEIRRWAEKRSGRPCREPSGRLALVFPHGHRLHRHTARSEGGEDISWDEFAAGMHGGGRVFAYDDAFHDHTCFLGSEDELRHWLERVVAGGEVENTLGP